MDIFVQDPGCDHDHTGAGTLLIEFFCTGCGIGIRGGILQDVPADDAANFFFELVCQCLYQGVMILFGGFFAVSVIAIENTGYHYHAADGAADLS